MRLQPVYGSVLPDHAKLMIELGAVLLSPFQRNMQPDTILGMHPLPEVQNRPLRCVRVRFRAERASPRTRHSCRFSGPIPNPRLVRPSSQVRVVR